MILREVGMLAVPNSRSTYYLQRLIENNYLPSFVFILQTGQQMLTPGQRPEDLEGTFVQSLIENSIDYDIISTVNVNAPEVVENLRKRHEKYFIYSGPGGAILKKEILNIGKKFLHIHPGRLPAFRGSTTIYYQILTESQCGVSAIFLDEKIDTGPIIASENFPLPQNMDLDYEYDPMIRADLLIKVIEQFVKKGAFPVKDQLQEAGETYYIMHPVLRHIVKLKLEK